MEPVRLIFRGKSACTSFRNSDLTLSNSVPHTYWALVDAAASYCLRGLSNHTLCFHTISLTLSSQPLAAHCSKSSVSSLHPACSSVYASLFSSSLLSSTSSPIPSCVTHRRHVGAEALSVLSAGFRQFAVKPHIFSSQLLVLEHLRHPQVCEWKQFTRETSYFN